MGKGQNKSYVERDVSWMYFNHRILNEAKKDSVPLLERLSFLGIYSNNLDEFFRVRVASINRILETPDIDKTTHRTLKDCLKSINRLNEKYSKEYAEAVEQVMGELESHGIRLRNEQQLNEEQQLFLTRFFYEKLNGSVLPIWNSQIDDISTLEDNRIYLFVEKLEVEEGGKTKYALIKVPDRQYGRWVKIPSSDGFDNIMYLDECGALLPATHLHRTEKESLPCLLVQIYEKMLRWRSTTNRTTAPWSASPSALTAVSVARPSG
jgi:polyphosphate kinase